MKRIVWLIIGISFLWGCQNETTAPEPYGLLPSERQLEWFERDIIAFFHYGIATYGGVANHADNSAAANFNPTSLDCGQWIRTLKAAGIPAGILTAKHADGFCLWQSDYTDFSVKSSPWKDGKGDVVKEFTEACSQYGIKAGIYLGPHDDHQHADPAYTTEAYKEYYAHQIEELMTRYGKVWETWWDGAGADELTTPIYSYWYDIVRKHQPDCIIFGTKNSYRFADVHWMGNEDGIAGDPCRGTIDSMSICREGESQKQLNEGEIEGNAYIPAESDVSIRPSWFFNKSEDDRVKSVAKLWDIYCKSSGHNSVLLLNLPPDMRGLIPTIDSLAVTGLRQCIDETFAHNLLKGSKVSVDNCRGRNYEAKNLIDDDKANYYAGKDGITKSAITFDLPSAVTFDCLCISEAIELGERITRWSVEYSTDGKKWEAIPEATDKQAVGHKWIVRFPEVKACHVRVLIQEAKACPVIRSFGIYKQSPLAF